VARSSSYRRLREHEATGQFVRYALIGCLNFALSIAVFTVLGRSAAAYAVAFLASNTLSFFLNKHWAFRDTASDVTRQYALFALFTAIGLVLALGTFRLLLIGFDRYGTAGRYAAYLGSVPIAVLWNFTAYRRWTFREARRTAAPGGSAGA
jgi:putative flippase GtrA